MRDDSAASPDPSGLITAAQTLAQVAAGVVLGEPTPDLADRLFTRLGPLLQLDTYVHYVCDEASQLLRLAGCAGVPADEIRALDPLPVGEAVCGTVAQLREPLAFDDVPSREHDGRLTLVRRLGLTAYVCHPLLAGGELRGTLSFGSKRRISFTSDEITLMRTASDIVAAGLARGQAEDALLGARREVGQLHEALDARGTIGCAVGILMVGHGCGFDEAFQLLVGASQRTNRKLREIAQEIVAENDPAGDVDGRAGRSAT